MNKFLSLALPFALAASTTLAADAGTREIIIGKAKVTAATHTVVLPDAPTPSEQQAASQFIRYFQQMTGEALPQTALSKAGETIPIYIGKCELPAKVKVKVNWDKLGKEGIHIQTSGNALVLAGGQRGCLYAVYAFLEDYLDCRWFAPDCIVIPNTGKTTIKKVKKIFVPPLEYRDIDYSVRRPPEVAIPNNYNGPYGTPDEKWGSNIRYCGFVHTFNQLVPPEKYGKEHPEYYSEINGKRVTTGAQLCLTNPDVLKIATEEIRRRMKAHPECTIFSVSQNDWRNYCECEKCTALAEKEGSQAGPLIHFVNAIADAVRDEFPDKAVDTLAYQYTRKPPKYVKPASNVIVRLCSIECCFAHPLESCPENASFVEDIKGWNKLTNRLHIWDYVINYRHCVQCFPNLRVLRNNIQFFVKHGVTGIYEEANYFSPGGELAELRTYLCGKFLWDPNYDEKKAFLEFTDAYYGPAAPMIRDYLNLLHDTVCGNKDVHVKIYSNADAYLNYPEMIAKCDKIFDDAEAAVAGDAKLLLRVQNARLGLMYTKMSLGSTSYKLNRNALCCESTCDTSEIAKIESVVKAMKITHAREGANTSMASWIASHKTGTAPIVIRTIRNQFLHLDILPSLGGRIWRAKSLQTGLPIILTSGDLEKGFAPDENGYEEYGNGGYRSNGHSEPYKVLDSGPTFVVLQATLASGVTLTRRIELLHDRPAFRVRTQLTTAKPEPEHEFRVHPAFTVADTNQALVMVKNAQGWREIDLNTPKAPLSEREMWFRDTDKPAGQWAIVDKVNKTILLNSFSTSDIATCYLNWNGKDHRINLEEWSNKLPTDANKGPVLDNTYELIPFDQAPWKN